MKRGERLRGRENLKNRERCVAPVAHLFCGGLGAGYRLVACLLLLAGSLGRVLPVQGQSQTDGLADLSSAQAGFEAWFEAWVAGHLAAGLSQAGDSDAEGSEEWEYWWSHFRRLWEQGVDLGRASREVLEGCGLLTSFQCASLLEYRHTYGGLSSVEELAWVDGFPAEWIERHRPFLRFSEDLPSRVVFSGVRHEAQFRGRYLLHPTVEAAGIPVGGSLVYRVKDEAGRQFSRPWELGLVLEQDAEEPCFPDYAAGFLALEDSQSWLRRLVLGSYSLRLGQGLVAWNGFSMGAAAGPAQLLRRSDAVVPYAGTGEGTGLTGVALTFGRGPWSGTLAWSSHRLDARVKDSLFFSLPADGYHRTPGELARRKTLWQHLGAVSGTYRRRHWQLGAQLLFCGYNKKDGRHFTDYRARTAYQGVWANASVDVRVAWSAMQVYGEWAWDRRGAMAFLAGWEWAPSYPWELAVQLRYYAPHYTAPFAGAWAAGSTVSNEHSVTAQALWRWGRAGSLAFSGVWVYYPASRYRVKVPSQAQKLRIHLAWNGKVWQGQGRWQWVSDPAYALPRHTVKLQSNSNFQLFSQLFSVKLQAVATWGSSRSGRFDQTGLPPWGRAVALQTAWHHAQWEVGVQGTAFHAEAWEDRVYLYQRTLPGTFSFPALYGRGFVGSVYLQYKPRRGWTFSGAWNRTGLFLSGKWSWVH